MSRFSSLGVGIRHKALKLNLDHLKAPRCLRLHQLDRTSGVRGSFRAALRVLSSQHVPMITVITAAAAPSLVPTRLRSLVPTWFRVTCAHVLRHLCPLFWAGERGVGGSGWEEGRGGCRPRHV